MIQPPKKSRLLDGRCEFGKKILLLVGMGTKEYSLFVWARCTDTVESVQVIIARRVGIPVLEQELYYGDKKLPLKYTLKDCSIVRKTELKLVDRRHLTDIIQNPHHEKAWEELHDFVFLVDIIFTDEHDDNIIFFVKDALSSYLRNMPRDDKEKAENYINIFISSAALSKLIHLCRSEIIHHESCAVDLISILLKWIKELPLHLRFLGAHILLQLCLGFSQSSHEYHLNNVCRSSLGNVIGYLKLSSTGKTPTDITLKSLSIILSDIVSKISSDLTDDGISNKRSNPFCPLRSDVKDFRKILVPVKSLTKEDLAHYGEKDIKYLRRIFSKFIANMGTCLSKLEMLPESFHFGCHDHIVLLNELHGVSQIFQRIKNDLWIMLRRWKLTFCYVMINHGRRTDNYDWILENKELITSECRRHLALLLFPELSFNVAFSHTEIDRSQLLEQSFKYITETGTYTLQSGLSVKFINEEATGPGVIREWFCLVCQALFDPEKDLFKACPHDRTRFFPNSASKSNPQYFEFTGRLVALALMHKFLIGILLDRVLTLQLAEKSISLEDIRDTDPILYRSYKQMLEMDPEAVDRDELCLRFYLEEDVKSGPKRIVELVPNGKNIAVNSKNRRKYADLLIQHYYVKSLEVHVSRFTKGFDDIIDCPRKRRLFFRSLEHEDLDGMLRGNEKGISVEEWKAHTEYSGYQFTDSQMVWFWKIVGDMSAEQKKNLLFFWTSVIYLPVAGFRGLLPSRLFIHKINTTWEHLPTSSTCFHRLYVPPYPSFEVMQDRLHIISQKHISFSFGES